MQQPSHTSWTTRGLRQADADTANWLTHGRTYSEQRHSPLKQINDTSIARLGLAWSVDMQTLHGLEATPLVKDGVMYLTGTWSVVYALDARTGAQKVEISTPRHRRTTTSSCAAAS